MHRLEERSFVKRFGSIWAGKKTKDKGFIWYNLMYIGRRLMLGMLVVFSRDTLFFCISGLVMQTILAMIVAGSTRAHDTRRANDMEYFNEVMILMVLYNMMCFTDFQPDEEIQYEQGYVMCVAVVFHIAFNLFLVLLDSIDYLRLRWRKYRMLRKFAKIRAEKHAKL
jgi:hypothetical protein